MAREASVAPVYCLQWWPRPFTLVQLPASIIADEISMHPTPRVRDCSGVVRAPHQQVQPQRLDRSQKFCRPHLEALEDRLAPAVVFWDGGTQGTGTDWNEASNWVGDVLPGPGDDARIGSDFRDATITSAGAVEIRSIDCAVRLEIAAGLFLLAADSSVSNDLVLGGGELATEGTLRLTSGSFLWTAGMMAGSGRTILGSAVTGTITDAAQKSMSRSPPVGSSNMC